MFEAPHRLLLGLATGILFGFLLQKGRVAKHSVIVGQLVLRDFTVLKIMLTAIAVGAVGYAALVAAGATTIDVKPAEMGGILVGALLFGAGLAVLGYCPGTTLAAVGEGRRDALAGLAGLIAGAFAFVNGFPALGDLQKAAPNLGELTLPEATSLAPIVWVVALLVAAAVTYGITQARGPKPRTHEPIGE